MSAIEDDDQQGVRRDAHPPHVRQGQRRDDRRRSASSGARHRRQAAKAATAATTLDPTLPSSWFEIHADNTILMRTGKVELGQGSRQHRLRADRGRGAERPVRGDHAGGHGRHRPHARRRLLGRLHRPAAPERPQGGRLHLPGAAQPRLDPARRPRRRASRVKNGVVSGGGKTVTYGELVSGQAAEPDDPDRQAACTSLFGLSVTGNPPTKPISEYTVVGQSSRCATIPPIVTGTGDLRRRRQAARTCCMPAWCTRRRSARRSSRSASSTRSAFPNTQVVVKGNLVAALDPSSTSRSRRGASSRAKTKWTDVGRDCPGAATSSRRSAQADWTTTPRRDGRSTSATPDAALASARRRSSRPATSSRSRSTRRSVRRCAVADVRKDGTVYVHVHSAEPAGDALGSSRRCSSTSIDNVVVRILRRLRPLRPLERRQHRRRGRGRDPLADGRQAGAACSGCAGTTCSGRRSARRHLGRPGGSRRERQDRSRSRPTTTCRRCRTTAWSARCSQGCRRCRRRTYTACRARLGAR